MAHSPSACRTRILRLFYFFLQYSPHHPHLHSFPTRRSSDLYRGGFARHRAASGRGRYRGHGGAELRPGPELRRAVDRKSTRLNSSHVAISYAVFCLKKKKLNVTAVRPLARSIASPIPVPSAV